MILSSFWAIAIVDTTIVVLVAITLAVAISQGMFSEGRMPRLGRVLIIAGVVTTGLYYLLDILAITVLPKIIGMPQSLAIVDFLHTGLRAAVSLLSLALVAAGIIVGSYQRKRIESSLEASISQVQTAAAGIMQSEARFRSLITTTPDPIYCLEFDPPVPVSLSIEEQVARSQDAVLVECNGIFARELELKRPGDAIGMTLGSFDACKDTESHQEMYQRFIENGYRLSRYEQIYKTPDGEDRALQITWNGVVENDCLVRIWGAEKNILDLKQTKAELRRRQRFQGVVADVSSRLLTTADDIVEKAVPDCLKLVCQFMHVDRATLVWLDRKTGSVDLAFFWNEHGSPPPVATSQENFPWTSSQTREKRAVCIDDILQLPEEAQVDKQSYQVLGLKSLAVTPLIVAGELVGAMTFSTFQAMRKWSVQDSIELKTLAELFGNVLQRINARKALDHALADLRRATDRLQAENVYLQHEIQSAHDYSEIVGESPQLIDCLKQVGQVADTSTPVLILGETGTGKELIARAVHGRSSRHDRPLVKVNCAALPANLVESELFGHEKGAFTGATSRKRGRFDLADGGTVFLDEIGDFPLELQGKLLRVLQEGEFERLGGSETVRVDVRLIAATNRNVSDAVDAGDFRADLFYRINTFPIILPPLRDRVGDVQILAEHFLETHAKRLNRQLPVISDAMLEQLNAYSWPGNVRELEGVMQRALISSNGLMLELGEPLVRSLPQAGVLTLPRTSSAIKLAGVEADHIRGVLEQSGWTIAGASGAAARLGIPPSTLRSKMKRLGIQRPA